MSTFLKMTAVAVTFLAAGSVQAQPKPAGPAMPPAAPAKAPPVVSDPMQLPAMRQLTKDLFPVAMPPAATPPAVRPRSALEPRPAPATFQRELIVEPGRLPWAPLPTTAEPWVPAFLTPTTLARVMNAKAFPKERALVLGWKESFPKLRDDFEVLGAGTPGASECATKAGLDGKSSPGAVIPGTYNCIAHTAGIKNVWVNPYQTDDGWDLYYAPLGFRRAEKMSVGFEHGVQKVAVYATKTPAVKLKAYTHAAIQDADGTWTSKLGSGPLVRHRTAEAVEGPTYGEVVRVYVKK